MKPTLFTKGYIVPTNADEKAKLADITPIDYISNIINKRVANKEPKDIGDRVIVIKAKTASGKSTVIPPRIYADFKENHVLRGRSIACLQPRVMNAATIPEQIIEHNPSLKLGDNIGYQTGQISEKSRGGIIFMTKEVLLQQLKTMQEDKFMQKYAFIIVDECHERSLSTDLVLYKLKKFLIRNFAKSECPLILLMSATFDAPKFARYFGGDSVAIVEVEGASYPISPHFIEVDSLNVIKTTIDTVIQIHTENESDYVANANLREHKLSPIRDILIFIFGAAHGRELAECVFEWGRGALGIAL